MEFRGKEEGRESGECFQAACSPQGWVDHLHFLTALGKGPGASSCRSEGYRLWMQNYRPMGEMLSVVSWLHGFRHGVPVQ